jgi:prefoldin alpha subunit
MAAFKSKYISSRVALKSGIRSDNEGKEVMVPLTESLYVPGVIHNEVMIDIGTGYYVPRTSEQAQGFMDRKIKFLDQRLTELQKVILQKRNESQQVLSVLQQKIRSSVGQSAPSS